MKYSYPIQNSVLHVWTRITLVGEAHPRSVGWFSRFSTADHSSFREKNYKRRTKIHFCPRSWKFAVCLQYLASQSRPRVYPLFHTWPPRPHPKNFEIQKPATGHPAPARGTVRSPIQRPGSPVAPRWRETACAVRSVALAPRSAIKKPPPFRRSPRTHTLPSQPLPKLAPIRSLPSPDSSSATKNLSIRFPPNYLAPRAFRWIFFGSDRFFFFLGGGGWVDYWGFEVFLVRSEHFWFVCLGILAVFWVESGLAVLLGVPIVWGLVRIWGVLGAIRRFLVRFFSLSDSCGVLGRISTLGVPIPALEFQKVSPTLTFRVSWRFLCR